ncbi:hypothetical protein SAMN04489867_0478 [Pedococcus dokdonensis]|uniref:DUF2530 domain-containing protein n=1 Tax=Pedococcus dokdonensis TaxID=443156 RepID=A0A1H0M248_9MICO|nr:hypothetical protein [Pedococcus dokdonensis]SDO74552.1 hypothetical protein SAMN04489867_0478 [Pedococcus dokdonensis]
MDPSLESEPRPETPAAGNALLWMTSSLLAFGIFLVAIPGRDPAGRAWLWIGLVLLVVGGVSSALAARARWTYLRDRRGD